MDKCWCGETAHSRDKHKRRGEGPCDGAREAFNTYWRGYYRKNAIKFAARKRELRRDRAYLIPEDDAL